MKMMFNTDTAVSGVEAIDSWDSNEVMTRPWIEVSAGWLAMREYSITPSVQL